MSRKTFSLTQGHSFLRTHCYKSTECFCQNQEKLYSIFPGRCISLTAQILFMPCNIYYYSNNILLSNLLDCSLRIRGKSRLVKFPVRYESLYLKNCPGRNTPFSVVDTQKRCHFIFHPQQYLMEEEKKNKKKILLSFTFYSLKSATLNLNFQKNLTR